ncbi:protein ycf2 [Phtheirospermum japonicum]|uniref:Protein ycf2 n=1 Tax=Phtheirospermum japonicum TaxID=374723 RepID=A0A830BDR7_9LAMI|nr:protein ycf2 [Phtheirospermum japonicum]
MRAIMREVLGFGRTLKGSRSFSNHDIPESFIILAETRERSIAPDVASLMKHTFIKPENITNEVEKLSKIIYLLKAKVWIEVEIENVLADDQARDADEHDGSSP